jgi:hypothetical protein
MVRSLTVRSAHRAIGRSGHNPPVKRPPARHRGTRERTDRVNATVTIGCTRSQGVNGANQARRGRVARLQQSGKFRKSNRQPGRYALPACHDGWTHLDCRSPTLSSVAHRNNYVGSESQYFCLLSLLVFLAGRAIAQKSGHGNRLTKVSAKLIPILFTIGMSTERCAKIALKLSHGEREEPVEYRTEIDTGLQGFSDRLKNVLRK